MNLIDYISGSYWKRTASATVVPQKSLGVFRWIYGFYVFLFATPTFSWIADIPGGFFDPPLLSVAYLFEDFPHGLYFQTLDIAVLTTVFLVTIGIKTRLFTILLLAMKIFALSFAYSMGKIDHGILENALLLCMVFAGWGRHYALLPDKKLNFESADRGLSLLATFLCFGMFSAGIFKLLFWVDFNLSSSGFLSWYYGSYYNLDYKLLLLPYMKGFPLIFYEIADYSAVLFEISGFIFLLWSRKAWKLWLVVAAFFHLSNTLVLNIPFIEHVIVYLAFVNYSSMAGKSLTNKLKGLSIIITIFFTVHIIQRSISTGAEILFINSYHLHQFVNVYAGLILWILTIAVLYMDYRVATRTTT